MNTPSRRSVVIGLWLATLLACTLVIFQTRFVSDLSAFMPQSPDSRQRLLIDQFHDGIIARLIMIGIEGGDAKSRAGLSQALAARLRAGGLFLTVQNGDEATAQRDLAYFFGNRYLLGTDIDRDYFSAPSLHRRIGESIDLLAGDAGMLVKRIFPRDPTGESLRLVERFGSGGQIRSLDGAWASQDGQRAVLLAYTRAPGTDTDAQARAIESIRQAFDGLPGRVTGSRLLLSGTSVFSVKSRDAIESQVTRLASASLVLVISLLLLVYRSPRLLAFGLLPVLSGALVGLASVSLVFGKVHGLTLGFGTTLIGEAVDYSIYFFLQRAGGMDMTRFWRTIWLGVATSIAGFATLLFSGFPGLAQLGVYTLGGLLAAAAVTRHVLPELAPQSLRLEALDRLGLILEAVLAKAYRLRWLPVLLALVSVAYIGQHAGEVWNRNLASLSPISKADQQIDQQLRNDLGAPDLQYMAAFSAPDQEQALEAADKARAVLGDLRQKRIIAGYTSPDLILPSLSAQRARQAAIPDEATLKRQLGQALDGLPVRQDKLRGFVDDLAAARTQPLLTRSDLEGTSALLLLDSLLIKRPSGYLVLILLRPTDNGPATTLDVDAVQTALRARLPDAVVIDLLDESTSLFENYRNEILHLTWIGGLAIVALLLAALRSVRRTLRVVVPLAFAIATTTAAILASGTQLTILHLVGLLLVFAIGSNYALFFERGNEARTGAERRQMQVSLLIANLTAVGSFGILGLSTIPVLSAIGITVGLGTLSALLFAAMLARSTPGTTP